MYKVMYKNEDGVTEIIHSGIATREEAMKLAYNQCKDRNGLQHYADGFYIRFMVRGMLHISLKWYIEEM